MADGAAVAVAAVVGAVLATLVGVDPVAVGVVAVEVVDELQAAIESAAPARTKAIRRTQILLQARRGPQANRGIASDTIFPERTSATGPGLAAADGCLRGLALQV
jgi:hypothetical protein